MSSLKIIYDTVHEAPQSTCSLDGRPSLPILVLHSNDQIPKAHQGPHRILRLPDLHRRLSPSLDTHSMNIAISLALIAAMISAAIIAFVFLPFSAAPLGIILLMIGPDVVRHTWRA